MTDIKSHIEAIRSIFKKRFSGEFSYFNGSKSPDIFKGKDDLEENFDWKNYGGELDKFDDEIYEYIDEKKLNKIKALIKETGFIAIPSESFSILENVTEYQKSSVKITLNEKTVQIHWPEQNATAQFIPPIITMVESELDYIISEIRE